MALIEKTFKALCDETRLRILHLLSREELNVNEVVEILEVAQSRVSRHLRILKEAGLVEDRRQGTWVFYRVCEHFDSQFPREVLSLLMARWREVPLTNGDLKNLEKCLGKRRQRSKEYFDRIASEWDNIQASFFSDSVRNRAIAEIVQKDLVVADVGTGTGYMLVALAPHVRKVIGIDNSEQMLAKSREKASELGIENAEFRLGEMDALPLADGEVDAVFANMVLHHAPEPGMAVTEIARVLKWDGKAVVTDLEAHDQEWMRQEMADLWLGFSSADMAQWMERAGLGDVRVERLSEKCCGRSMKGHEAALPIFVATGRKRSERWGDQNLERIPDGL